MASRKNPEQPALVVVDNTAAGEQSNPRVQDDEAALDEYEELARDTILNDDDGDEPGAKEETSIPDLVKNLPKFCNFRANTTTFDLWGASDRQGMDDLVFFTTKKFAPKFEEDLDLRRVRIFETVTSDGVIRWIYCFVPEKGGRKPNLWTTSKLAALELAQTRWMTMRSRRKLQQYTHRPSAKDHGEPKFGEFTRAKLTANLLKLGLLVISEEHPFFRKVTDTEE
jgi:hypothetical protein